MPQLNNKTFREAPFVPLLVLFTVIATVILTPLKIISIGYLPQDDALRHAAKVLSGKDWNEILVVRDDIVMDSHPGWHAILASIHRLTGCDADLLVVFSVIFLFCLFCIIPVLLLNRPEAWLISLLLIAVVQFRLIMRLFLGRPYLFTMAVVLLLCLLWPLLRDKKTPRAMLAMLTLLIAASTWIHCSWYLFALPLVSFCLAREWRASFRLGIATIAGVMIGAFLTRHPCLFLKQTFCHPIWAFGSHQLQRMLVGEFQPFSGDVLIIMVVFFLFVWRKMRGAWNSKSIDNPVFILALTGWVLGFISRRFWLDWGMPAISVWMAFEFRDALESKIGFFDLRRLILAVAVGGIFYLSVTSDVGGRWTYNLTTEYLSRDNPEQKSWLPGPAGIVYSDDMAVFYDTFFKNPDAPWRYVLGFEPAMMNADDLAIFRKIQWNYGDDKAFEPWVRKMRPEDRLILRRSRTNIPNISELEWHYAATGLWIGRLRGEKD